MKFVGWIPGNPLQRRRLRQLGVQGRMRWNPTQTAYGIGAFSHCEADEQVMKRLIQEWKLPNPGSFTLVDDNDDALPMSEQYEWYEKWKEYQRGSN